MEVTTLKTLRAVIIEDELIFTTKLKSSLTSLGYAVSTAKDVSAAKELITLQKPDLIFLDNFLPVKSGSESITEIKSQSPDSHVVFMSSAFDITIVSEAIEKGADFILNKKQNLDEVLDPIIKSIQQQKQSVNSENFVEKTTFQKSNDAPKIIAILEDEETFSLNLQWILNSLAKKTVIHSFSNSADFIGALIENTQFDFVFSDLYLDESTLKDAMEFIKNKIPNSKLVVLSAQADVNDAIELKTRGIDYFIKKDTNWKFNFLNVLRKLELY